MTVFEYLILFSVILASGLAFIFIEKKSEIVLTLSLAFSGAFLFTISIIHLVPSLFIHTGAKAGYFILAGFFIQIIIEFFSEGIEHGHTHQHVLNEKSFPVTMMVGLSLHSFLEGMPLEGNFGDDHAHEQVLLTGIVLHHIPVALALMSMLLGAGLSKAKAICWLAVFASMAPLGALTSLMLTAMEVNLDIHFFDYIMAVVIGIFLHISTTILFESNKNHRFNLIKIITVLAGGITAALLF